jgi:hypothetical protein
MTLAALTEQVRDYIPNKPVGQVSRAANMILRKIGRDIGPVERTTLTTKAIVTADDGQVVEGSDVFTVPTPRFSAEEAGQLIRIGGNEAWFTIAAFMSTTQLKLSSVWPDATATGLSYTVAYPLFTFPDDVLEIVDIGEERRAPLPRIASDREYYDNWRIEPRDHVTAYIQRAFGYNGRLAVQWQPPTITAQVLSYTYRKKPLYYNAEDPGSVCDFPDVYSDAILFGTLHLLWDQEDTQDRSQYWFQKYSMALSDIYAQDIVRAEGVYQRARVMGTERSRTYNKTPIQ